MLKNLKQIVNQKNELIKEISKYAKDLKKGKQKF